jgi:hypothetical protein
MVVYGVIVFVIPPPVLEKEYAFNSSLCEYFEVRVLIMLGLSKTVWSHNFDL